MTDTLMMKRTKNSGTQLRVALLIESWDSFGRRVLQGIAAYAGAYGPWTFHHEHRTFDDPVPAGLAKWKPDGVIARIATPRMAAQIRSLRVPVVDLFEQHTITGASRVLVNHDAVARLAVEHLAECGFRHFAYVGMPHLFSEERARFFARRVADAGAVALAFRPERDGSLPQWLDRLPKPVGIMACNDAMAQRVLTACGEHGIAVPDAVAAIGVDNDEVHCDLCAPTLSSVDSNGYRVGYEAAALLRQMIMGRRRSPRTVVVDPSGVVRRRSTDVLAFADPRVAAVLRYIRDHACEGLTTRDVLRNSRLSRATLDRCFRRFLKRTPRAEIARVQARRMQELLVTTDLPLKQIARLAGFAREETMYRVFKRETGLTPAQHRRRASTRGVAAG
jgi:LacI family transcriptional regulator